MKKIVILTLLSAIGFHFCAKNETSKPRQEKSAFVDLKNGYETAVPDSFSLSGGCYHWPAHPDNTDTSYIKISYKGQRIIFGDFVEIGEPIQNDSDFKSFCIGRGILASAADGPDGGTYCENIDSGLVRINPCGVRYAEIYLRKFITFLDSDTNFIAGPYFFIDISNAKKKQAIYLDYRPNDGSPSEEQIYVSKEIIKKIRLIN